MEPSVSVIVAVKDGAQYLPEALASVRRQTAAAIDLVVVDARSRDDSRAIAAGFGATIVDQRDGGLGAAWNLGLDAAACPLVAFIDSDDVWTDDAIALRAAALAEGPEAGICHGAVRHFTDRAEAGRPLRRAAMDADHVAPIPGTMLFRREVFGRVGRFDPGLALSADADWIARAVSLGIGMVRIPQVVLLKRLHGANLTHGVATVQSELLTVLRRKIAAEGRGA